MRQVFVGNIAWKATEDDIRNAFEGKGIVVEDVRVMKEKSGQSKGFAFVRFDDETNLEHVIDTMNGLPLRGRPIDVQLTRPRGETKRGARS